MHIGMASTCQNPENSRPDGEVYRNELALVVVLPWHDPVRVAEQVSMLDHVSGGRLILGLGRGAGRTEFEGFRIPMSESRERFIEAAQLVLNGLEEGYVEFDGQHYQQPRKDVRPKPERTFRGRTYAAAVSPESVEIMAKLGLGILVIPPEALGRHRPGAHQLPQRLPGRERRACSGTDHRGLGLLR